MTNEFIRDLQLINAAALVSMIWIIQIVHYPSFVYYDKSTFAEAMNFHQKRIIYIVLPLMLTEIGISIYLWVIDGRFINTIGLACVLVIWASTFFIQVPTHEKLKSYDSNLIEGLVKGNLIRTVLWTIKLLLIEQDRLKGF